MRFVSHSHLYDDCLKDALLRHRKKDRNRIAMPGLNYQVRRKLDPRRYWLILFDDRAGSEGFSDGFGRILPKRAGRSLGRQEYEVLQTQQQRYKFECCARHL
jgi:hypothetical protein